MKNINYQTFKIAFILVFSVCILNSNASNQPVETENQPTEWEIYKEIDGIQIYYKYSDCIDKSLGLEQKLVLLKFVNTTDNSFSVKWQNELWYDGECWTCKANDKSEYNHKIILQKGSHLEGTCKHGENTDLQIFAGYLNHDDTAKLTKFELKDIKIVPVY
jgi:hypothetical protein